MIRDRTIALLLMLVLVLGSGCAISEEQEVALGMDARGQFEQEAGGLYDNRDTQSYVQQVGMSLARHADRPDLPWEFRVLESDQINAFALPGGFIYITTGLLRNLENEAQMAYILGHEAAHVAHRHSVDQLQRSQVVGGAASLAGLLGGENVPVGDIGQLVGGLLLMNYSREQETEADLTGLRYLAEEGYDRDAAIQATQILQRLAGEGGPPEFLSTHPSDEHRIAALQERIEKAYGNVISAGRTDAEDYRQNVLRYLR